MSKITDYLKQIKEKHQSKEEVYNIVYKVYKNQATAEDIEKLCNLLIYNSGYFEYKPKEVIVKNLGYATGQCSRDGSIKIDKLELEKASKNGATLMYILNVIGHEMRHLWQSEEMQRPQRGIAAEYLDMIARDDFYNNGISESGLKILLNRARRKAGGRLYVRNNGKTQEFGELSPNEQENYIKKLSLIDYFDLENEGDARLEGNRFVYNLTENLLKQSKDKEFNRWIKENQEQYHKEEMEEIRAVAEADISFGLRDVLRKIKDKLTFHDIENNYEGVINIEFAKFFLSNKTDEEINDFLDVAIRSNTTSFVDLCLKNSSYRHKIDVKRLNDTICETLKHSNSKEYYSFEGIAYYVNDISDDLIDTLTKQKRLVDLECLYRTVDRKSSFTDKNKIAKIQQSLMKLTEEVIDKYHENIEKYGDLDQEEKIKFLYKYEYVDGIEKYFDGIYLEDFKAAMNLTVDIADADRKYHLMKKDKFGFKGDKTKFSQFSEELHLDENQCAYISYELDEIAPNIEEQQHELCDQKYGPFNRIDYKGVLEKHKKFLENWEQEFENIEKELEKFKQEIETIGKQPM